MRWSPLLLATLAGLEVAHAHEGPHMNLIMGRRGPEELRKKRATFGPWNPPSVENQPRGDPSKPLEARQTAVTQALPSGIKVGNNINCGPKDGACAPGYCCSASGWCGQGSVYCNSPDCQISYGPACDGNIKPNGPDTSNDPRPLKGSVPYGGVGIYACVNDGDVAITYDDGPYIYTAAMLDAFKAHGAVATWFITGTNIGKGQINVAYRDVIQRMVADGHQIASHTWSHENLDQMTKAQRKNQMVYNEIAFMDILGFYPTYMRPPYSICGTECQNQMVDLGYHITFFDLDTQGYLHTDASQIGFSVNLWDQAMQAKSPCNGSYLHIEHDIHQYIATTLTDHILDSIVANGWRAVTVGECLGDPVENWYRGSNPGYNFKISAISPAVCSITPSATSRSPTTQSGRPSATSTALPVSDDNTCGEAAGKTCLGAEGGNCCSKNGWCGSGAAYCGTGCQSGFGTCANDPVSISSSSRSSSSRATSSRSSTASGSSSRTGTSGSSSRTGTSSSSSRTGTSSSSSRTGTSSSLGSSTSRTSTTSSSSSRASSGTSSSRTSSSGSVTAATTSSSSRSSSSSTSGSSSRTGSSSSTGSTSRTSSGSSSSSGSTSRTGSSTTSGSTSRSTSSSASSSVSSSSSSSRTGSSSVSAASATSSTSGTVSSSSRTGTSSSGTSSSASGSSSSSRTGTASSSGALPSSTLPVSLNAECGPSNGRTCLGSAFGNCCSQYNYCGTEVGHCGDGCQSTFGVCGNSTLPSGTASSASGSASAAASSSSSSRASGTASGTAALPSSTFPVSVVGDCGAVAQKSCIGYAFGNCCSQYNFCGDTPAHCGDGCQPGFGNCTNSASGSVSSAAAGGSSSVRPTSASSVRTGTATTSNPAAASNTKPSTDGKCGGTDGFMCQGTSYGDCCSPYGYCGSEPAHCNVGCQSKFGKCSGTGTDAIVSLDGKCGDLGSVGQETCQGSTFGNCCSAYGYCGNSTEHCGTGCKSQFGTCSTSNEVTSAGNQPTSSILPSANTPSQVNSQSTSASVSRADATSASVSSSSGVITSSSSSVSSSVRISSSTRSSDTITAEASSAVSPVVSSTSGPSSVSSSIASSSVVSSSSALSSSTSSTIVSSSSAGSSSIVATPTTSTTLIVVSSTSSSTPAPSQTAKELKTVTRAGDKCGDAAGQKCGSGLCCIKGNTCATAYFWVWANSNCYNSNGCQKDYGTCI